jgi:hypothetical protein
MGDPELTVWTKDPQRLTVEYSAVLNVGAKVSIDTTPGAAICLITRDHSGEILFYEMGTADNSGAFLSQAAPPVGELCLTATKHNYLPHQGGISVIDPNKPTVWTGSLPDGELAVSYSHAIDAKGGTTPYTWTVGGGTPPAGLSLNSTGTVSGTPTSPGDFTFTAKVTDGSSQFGTGVLPITIRLGRTLLADPGSWHDVGSYTIEWNSSVGSTKYELQEDGININVADDMESGTGRWNLGGWVTSTTAHSGSTSLYSGGQKWKDISLMYNGPIRLACDIPKVKFWCKYDITEAGSTDNGFHFQVSKDGGETWITLKYYEDVQSGWKQMDYSQILRRCPKRLEAGELRPA